MLIAMTFNDDPDATQDEMRPTDEVVCDHVWRFMNSRNAFVCTVCYEHDFAD